MTEIIAKRNKKPYIFMLALSVVTILASTVFMRIHIPSFKIAAIIFASILALFSIYLLVIIIDPRGGILRKGDDLLLRSRIFYTTVKISDIKDVRQTMVKSGDGEIIQDGSVTVIAVCDGQITELTVYDLLDVDEAIMKLKELAKI